MDKINQVITQLIPHVTEVENGVAEAAKIYQFKDGKFVVHLRVGLLGVANCKKQRSKLQKGDF
ncbi:hypothetical protein PN499_22240 [Kamptonema animale CS-326]|uniref:hypothetical protein n=1 Tax=Kamptonema animale TaxID=92934 RepID=UPI00232C735E|nr:hypothetical protein [Kamptonema animale]MDB9513924.1 hypothetical protein [Kamptonema animale CS-326]